MKSFFSFTRTLHCTALGALLLAASGCSNVGTPTAAESLPPELAAVVTATYADDPAVFAVLDAAVTAAGTNTSKLATLERRLLAMIQAPDATPAAVQAAAQRLGTVFASRGVAPDAATLAVFKPMFTDAARVDVARLALERVPGATIDALYLDALPAAAGHARLAVIQGIGARGIAASVPALALLLDDADAGVAAMAASSLAHIGGASALDALNTAKGATTPRLLEARLTAAASTDAAIAARTYESILRNAALPVSQRAAALRGLINARPDSAAGQIHEALLAPEPAFHAVALEAVSALPASGASAELVGRLSSYPSTTQTALIAALASRGDAGAVSGLLKAIDSADVDVRIAAFNALGRLPGDVAIAQRLASFVRGSSSESKAAFSALARLNGPGIDAHVAASAAKGDVAQRAVYIQQIAARNLTESIPFLFALRNDPDANLRLEGLDALRTIAPPSQQSAVIAWALAAPSRAEQVRAVRALISIILRDDAADTRATTLIKAIDTGDSEARTALLPVLSRIGGAQALAAAGRLALSTDAAVASGTIAELGRWPDLTALPVLAETAAKTSLPAARDAATLAAVRFLERTDEVPAGQRSALAASLLDLSIPAASQRALVRVLGTCTDARARDVATRFLAVEGVAAEARDTVDAINANLAWPPVFQASDKVADAVAIADGKLNTAWSVTGTPGHWFSADLKVSRPVRKVTLKQGNRGWDYPARVEIYVSDDPAQKGTALATADGERGQTAVRLPEGTRGRYLWVYQTGDRTETGWSVSELAVE